MAQFKNKPPQHAELMAILQDNYILAVTPDGKPFATDRWRAPCIALPLKGSRTGLRQRLAADMYTLTGRMPSQDAQATVMGVAEGIAGQGRRAQQALRAARRAGDAFLDLGQDDGLSAVIHPAGWWELSSRVPVLWRRSNLLGALPCPAGPGTGSLENVRHLFNIPRAGGQWAAFTACRVGALLYPASTHPVEIFTSNTSGSLKTATARLAKAWTDPGPFLPVPKDARGWASTAGNVYVAAIDNVSFIAVWWSDLLCKGASGDAWADRALYTDNEAFSAQFSIVPVIDGIGVVSLRADLADRAIRHHLTRPAAYLGDEDVDQAWERGHPAALGWLLDQAAATARMHAAGLVPKPTSGRMATYEWVLAAIDALWRNGGAGMSWWKQSQAGVAGDAVAADPVASAIQEVIMAPFTGTASQLFQMIAPALPRERDDWTPQRLGKCIPRAVDALSKVGWRAEQEPAGHAGRRRWWLCPPGQ